MKPIKRAGTAFVMSVTAPAAAQVQLDCLEDVCLGEYSGACSTDQQAQQGVTVVGSNFVTSRGTVNNPFKSTRLYAFEPSASGDCAGDPGAWMEIADASAEFAGSLNHIGDIAADDSFIFAPMSDFSIFGASEFHIARFDVSTMDYVDHWDITSLDDEYTLGDVAGAERDGVKLFIVEWQDDTPSENAHIFEFDAIGDSLDLVAAYPIETRFANGIVCKNGYFLVAFGEASDEGRIHVYERASLTEGVVNLPIGPEYEYDASGDPGKSFDHAEGLTFRGDELWVCAGAGDYMRRIETPDVLFDCPIDLDNDGFVGVTDLIIVITDWACIGACDGDIDGDGTTGVLDLITLITEWGPCPG